MGPHKHEVPDDEVTVIFISDSDAVKTRGLFTILNRTARRVSKNDVLIMSETDGAAMAARKVTSSNLLAPRGLDNSPLIKWESNTISRRDTQITTLNAITEIVSIVARINNIPLGDEQDAEVQPTPEAVDKASQVTLEWLDLLFKSLPLFQELRENPNRVSEERAGERPYSLLLRPVGLIAFFKAISVATDPHKGGLTDLEDAFRRMTKVDWSADSGLWRNIMVNAKGNISNKVSDLDLAAELAAWMVTGRSSNKSFQTTLTENFQRQLGRADAQLPAPVFAS
jgi:DNA sulfur modification protein DndB